MRKCETSRRLLTLLYMLERAPAPFGAAGTDAILDAWFGPRYPVFPLLPRAELAGGSARPDEQFDAR